jgi:Protein of unknown function (DUF1838)
MGMGFARAIAPGFALAEFGAAAAAKPDATIDVGTPEGAITAFRKVQCSTSPTIPSISAHRFFRSRRTASRAKRTCSGTYHAVEMFNFFGRLPDLTDPKIHSADVNVAWARISDWLPWMKMRGRAGNLYFNRRHARGNRGAWPDFQGAAVGRRPAPLGRFFALRQ